MKALNQLWRILVRLGTVIGLGMLVGGLLIGVPGFTVLGLIATIFGLIIQLGWVFSDRNQEPAAAVPAEPKPAAAKDPYTCPACHGKLPWKMLAGGKISIATTCPTCHKTA